MRIRWERASRLPSIPGWALAVIGGWGLLLVVAEWAQWARGVRVSLCLFRNLTGHPCPTCGSTRIVIRLLEGRLGEALLLNPLMVLALLVGGGLLALRAVTGHALRLEAGRRTRRAFLLGAFGLVLLDWWWVLGHA